jgi:hypothetical protein
VLSGPDTVGTTWRGYCWSVPVGAADSGATVTVTWSASGRPCIAGVVLSGQQTPVVGTPLTGSSITSATMPSVTNQSGDTVEIALTRTAAPPGPTTTLPSPYTNDAAAVASYASGVTPAAAIGVDTGAGGGTVTLSSSGGIAAYSVSLAPSAVSVAPTGTVTISGSAVAREVEIAASTGQLTISGSAVAREVEIAASTGQLTISGSAVAREVEIAAPTGQLTISGSAVVREVISRAEAGTVTIAGSAAVLSGVLSGAQITVTIGSWEQTWELGTELDEAALDMINAEGCVLDNMTASWSAPGGMMSQPDPTVCSFSVYVPAAAAGPELDQGAIASVLVEPRGGSDADYLPLLELTGAVSDGTASPLRDGLVYDVVVTDFLADLGEQKVGNAVWRNDPDANGIDYRSDYDVTNGSYYFERLLRLQRAMAADGQSIDYDIASWNLLETGDYLHDVNPMDGWMNPNFLGPAFTDTDGSPRPTNEVLEETLREATNWGPNWRDFADPLAFHLERRYGGYATYDRRVLKPDTREWTDFGTRPVAFSRPDRGDYGVHWVSQRIEGNAGIALQLVTGDDGKLTTRARALDGVIPDSSKHGAWVPAGAIARDSVSWTVNKDAHPRTARATGWFRGIEPYGESGNGGGEDGVSFVSASDWLVGYSYGSDQGTRPVEAQVDLPEISGDTDANALDLTAPQAVLWSLLGWLYDSQPLYELGSVEIRYAAIGDPRAWPRLFQQPDQDMNAPDYDWFSGAQGRFLFVYDIAPKWHPYSIDHWWGFLTGATLTVAGGKITATAQLAHRTPGPVGPRGTPTDPTGNDRWKLLVPDTPQIATWDDIAADFPSLTSEDMAPTLTWASLAMATT